MTDGSLYKLFWTTAYRITGKRTNPHLVRDMIVTYLRSVCLSACLLTQLIMCTFQ